MMKATFRLTPAMLVVFGILVFGQNASEKMSFFITSVGSGKGADLGGLTGADQHCQALAKAVGAGNRTWHAYLSTEASGNQPAVNARDRIGKGPWYNAKGVMVAKDVNDLHKLRPRPLKPGFETGRQAGWAGFSAPARDDGFSAANGLITPAGPRGRVRLSRRRADRLASVARFFRFRQ